MYCIVEKSVNMCQKSNKKMYYYSHENVGFEALHFHREPKQVKKRLPFALSKLSKQNIFQMIKRLIRIVADINCVKNVLKDLLGQAGKGISIVPDEDGWYC